jgi:hypothetical protein
MVFIFKITLPNTQTKKTVSPASERDHWLRMIEECRAVDCGELERMACEELGVDLKEHVGTTRRRVSSLSSSSQGKTSGDVEMTDAGIEEGGDNDSDKTVEKKAGGTTVTAGAKSSATAEETSRRLPPGKHRHQRRRSIAPGPRPPRGHTPKTPKRPRNPIRPRPATLHRQGIAAGGPIQEGQPHQILGGRSPAVGGYGKVLGGAGEFLRGSQPGQRRWWLRGGDGGDGQA